MVSRFVRPSPTAALILYTLLLRLALPLALARLYWRGLRVPAYRHRVGERLAWGAPAPRAGIWIHAVSVGEVQAAEPLIRSLLERAPSRRILVTTTTPTGAARLRALFGDAVSHRYTPFDLPGILERFLDRIRPRLAIVMETEIWPNTLNLCARRGIPVVLANARLSERSARGYARLAGLTRATLERFALIAAQADADAQRFIALGANPRRVRVMGSIKFDLSQPADLPARAREMRRLWCERRPVWVAASTHEGEDGPLLEAHRRVLERIPNALLVLVPRHPERFEHVAALVERHGLSLVRRSRHDACRDETAVFLGDTMGELPIFLAAGDAAFIGGSLVPTGGHNPLEAAAAGVPVATGPHTFNFAAIMDLLVREGAAARIESADALADLLIEWLTDAERRANIGARGQRVIARNRGALVRLIDLIEGVVGKSPDSGDPPQAII
ncbi:lipid IV(A) 3-deoxy-D-manno-octulosonic acid transferase [Thiocystis violascens]|uniref:3-deoxy-D-manno-octulosonic acid transferase n=1 Tax=Thiocystis violascens (strain ATCC 17096 / DSM 198 / 6111) TaxID=765911 RepID=I3YAN8_THIV6|nr:lipid IV(A) 3-deoxy-D-manno-octulosonic acid transferase [Thiocystis violascens]AFL74056.1 3-deoxy-D-manno-octulosonic-acid transferase [Thiocystis violascens DSM 198]